MIITGHFAVPQFNYAKYQEALDAAMEQEIKKAARAWLAAMISDSAPRVPVWTGTARGTLMPLGRFLNVAIPINPVVTRKGMGPSVGASKSFFKFGKSKGKYTFEWGNDVFHFIRNEFYNAPDPPFHLKDPTPWNVVLKANEAFEDYIQNELPKRIPELKKYIKTEIKRIPH